MSISIHLGDDVRFLATFKDENNNVVSISSATEIQFIFDKNGTPWIVNGSKIGSGSGGQMEYNATGAEIDTLGPWGKQGRVVIGGKEYHSDITYFEVKPNLPVV